MIIENGIIRFLNHEVPACRGYPVPINLLLLSSQRLIVFKTLFPEENLSSPVIHPPIWTLLSIKIHPINKVWVIVYPVLYWGFLIKIRFYQ